MQVCSTAFEGLGHSQAKALGYPDLPIAIVPHPFGLLTRERIRQVAEHCADDIVRLACEPRPRDSGSNSEGSLRSQRAELIEVPEDLEQFNRFFYERQLGDGLMMTPPTAERVERMLHSTRRARDDVVGSVAPAYGAATVERIAINAVLAGCYPEYLPILIAATEAIVEPQFNLQVIQATTNPAAVWLVVNGPVTQTLHINSAGNCLGPGAWANATLGRAMRLIQQNIGGALPGQMDRATHGQPGKYTFCCAENEAESPWEPLHVERGFNRDCSTVTVIDALGTLNVNTHSKNPDDLLRVFADTMAFPTSNDYFYGGAPWLILGPEHANILKRGQLTKGQVKARLWELSKMAASRLASNVDFEHTRETRRAELGDIGLDTLLPISKQPDDINIIVAGGPGTHSVYIPSGQSRSVTRKLSD